MVNKTTKELNCLMIDERKKIYSSTFFSIKSREENVFIYTYMQENFYTSVLVKLQRTTLHS